MDKDNNHLPEFLKLSKDEQKAAIEVLLFTTEEPLPLKSLNKLLIFNGNTFNGNGNSNTLEITDDESPEQLSIENEILNQYAITIDYVESLIEEINQELFDTNRPFQIVKYAGGWQFATRTEYGELIQQLIKTKAKRKLTQAALETLSIIAYRQPVTKPEIDQIRGVNSSDVINSLIERNLVIIAGRKDVLGRPLLYATSKEFLKVFGINSLNELPKLKEFEEISDQNLIFEKDTQDFHYRVVIDKEINEPDEENFPISEIINNTGDTMVPYDDEFDVFDEDSSDELSDDFDELPEDFDMIDNSFENYGEEGDENSII